MVCRCAGDKEYTYILFIGEKGKLGEEKVSGTEFFPSVGDTGYLMM
jgi:hypothetical protein